MISGLPIVFNGWRVRSVIRALPTMRSCALALALAGCILVLCRGNFGEWCVNALDRVDLRCDSFMFEGAVPLTGVRGSESNRAFLLLTEMSWVKLSR
jgi:hypothetical protein